MRCLRPKKRAVQSGEDVEEVRAFLHWLSDDNFTFLGYRDIDLMQDSGTLTSIRIAPKGGLGVLRDGEIRMFGGLRDFDKRKSAALRKYARQDHVLFITKTNAITRVHRVLPMDAVFVRRFNDAGEVIGERLIRRTVHLQSLCPDAARHSFYAAQNRRCCRAHELPAQKS